MILKISAVLEETMKSCVHIPGEEQYELPPLLVHGATSAQQHRMLELATQVTKNDDLIPSLPLDLIAPEAGIGRRKMDMALNLVDAYLLLVRHWHWGNGVLEWIRQCEITFESRPNLRSLLRPDIWPHAGRSSFVTLLGDKEVKTEGVSWENAVGLRLTFRQPPPISCFSDQFLFYLNRTIMPQAYQAWANLNPAPVSTLPPERFSFQVVVL